MLPRDNMSRSGHVNNEYVIEPEQGNKWMDGVYVYDSKLEIYNLNI